MSKPQPAPEGPDFVGVGVQKCGTTWIGDIIGQHPDAFVEKKEISFFTRYFHKGYGWYHRFFKDKGGRLAGEISVNYMYSPRPDSTRKEFYPHWNPRRRLYFWRTMPSARDELRARYSGLKVFALFRNPADRAWSHYWMWRNRRERKGKAIVPFERMFRDDGRWMSLQGNFADLLAHWREAFPDIGIFFHDDLVKDADALAVAVYRFLGVDETFKPDTGRKINQGSYRPMPADLRGLAIETYREQIERFSEMTGRDLSHWLEIPKADESAPGNPTRSGGETGELLP